MIPSALVRVVGAHPRHHRQEGVVVDFTGQAEGVCAVTKPDTAWFTGIEVVVRQLLDVIGVGIGAFQGGHPDGHRRLSGSRCAWGVHPSVKLVLNVIKVRANEACSLVSTGVAS